MSDKLLKALIKKAANFQGSYNSIGNAPYPGTQINMSSPRDQAATSFQNSLSLSPTGSRTSSSMSSGGLGRAYTLGNSTAKSGSGRITDMRKIPDRNGRRYSGPSTSIFNKTRPQSTSTLSSKIGPGLLPINDTKPNGFANKVGPGLLPITK
jgi:hypothetical protein